MNVVPDASVVVKWFVPERDHRIARDLRDDYLDGVHELLAPDLLPFEVVNALRYSGHYAGRRLEVAAEAIGDYGIDLRPFAASGQVATVAEAVDVTVYDASYIAIADDTEGVLYTADRRLVEAVGGSPYEDRVAALSEYG